MTLGRSSRIALAAFAVFDLLLAGWLVWLFAVRERVDAAGRLDELGVARYPRPAAVAPFALTDQDGGEFGPDELRGRWSMVFFGFVDCPDICPLALSTLGRMRARLAADGAVPPRIVFVSVNPSRDTPARVKDYVGRFDPAFIGLTGEPAEVTALARGFFVASRVGDDGMVDHSGHISVVSPAGELAAVVRPPFRERALAEAFRILSGG